MSTREDGAMRARRARRHLRNEADFRLSTIGDVLELHRAAVAAGLTRREADGLCMWVIHQHRAGAPVAAKQTRSKYRRALADIAGAPPNEPGTGRPPAAAVG